ncbi:phage baseplate assembly protein V [Limnobaculum zhutongyuii]|uniref:Phage baseplate assembly protein V n=1 Tax=Limnobaculum zhutongyuii TaxID=2498113 RepID=A0A411WMH4_9GAMM|nr:phage baseplate assembly protein V [Limnobaculum zhutongyuii]QBH97346.1 phage baseplate assembly protein V [Limnobaculum zhutongyuii]TQS90819.1 phage baseplate assembly protein V [Limnobaculum zhutongyuii]
MDSFELLRLLCNLIRFGTVVEVDYKNYKARVETGGNVTDWIRWGIDRAGDAQTWWAPSKGEQVLLLCPEGALEKAVICFSLYTDDIQPPDFGKQTRVTKYPDGAVTHYSPESGALTVSGVKTITVNSATSVTVNTTTATINATGSVTLDTPEVICTNHLTTGTLTVKKGGSMQGNITHTGGNFSSNGIVVHTHTHGGVDRGSSSTDGPQ